MSDRRHSAEVTYGEKQNARRAWYGLAMNPEAMQKYALLPETKKQEIINGTHTISSKAEMKQYVENIKSAY